MWKRQFDVYKSMHGFLFCFVLFLFWFFFFFFFGVCLTTWLKRSRVWICSTRYIKSEKRLIRSILIQLVLQRRIGWKGLVWHQRDLGRDGLNSRMSSSPTWRELMQENLSRTKKKGPLLHCILFLYVMLCYVIIIIIINIIFW